MNTLSQSRVASVAPIIALSAPAFASLDGLQDCNVNFAKLNYAFDTDGNGDITVDGIIARIIDGHVAEFDIDKDGIINADERGFADLYIRLS